VTGESYAGKYIPAFSYYIWQKNTKAHKDDFRVNMQGLAIGNGMIKVADQFAAVPLVARDMGLISEDQYQIAMELMDKCYSHIRKHPNDINWDVCEAVQDKVMEFAGNPFVYDVRLDGNAFDTVTTTMGRWLNSPEVKAALHVGNSTWISGDGTAKLNAVSTPLRFDLIRSVSDEVLNTLLTNYRVLFYNGNMDVSCCNHLGVARVLDALHWAGAKEYRNANRVVWHVDGHVAGYVRHAKANDSPGSLTFVVLVNCGHLVPTDQPIRALDMIHRFIHGIDSWENATTPYVRPAIVSHHNGTRRHRGHKWIFPPRLKPSKAVAPVARQ